MSSIALVDCNNFFVSCERVFNPKLKSRPVGVLSCNDGCIISRSAELKALGVPMGAPYFQWADFLKKHDVAIFSSNFALYADLSHRVMGALTELNPELEIYSIDEAFLGLSGIEEPLEHVQRIRQKILQWVGIPVSIGVGSTKTLAKVAGDLAKKRHDGILFPSKAEMDAELHQLAVGDVWGIGRRLSKFLAKHGIYTAGQLCAKSDAWIKSQLSVVGLRTVWELRGISCLDLEETPAPKQSVMTSRSFGRAVFSLEDLRQAVCTHAARGGEKLREEQRAASWLQVFIMTSLHKDESYYANQALITFAETTNYTPALLDAATQGLKKIFRPGFAYKRAGVLLGGLTTPTSHQLDLFQKNDPKLTEKRQTVMTLVDQAKAKYGPSALQFASVGFEKSWQMKNEHCSPCYTTRWSDLLTIEI